MSVRTDLALAEAVCGLDEQRDTVDPIQQRAGVLLAFAAIANVGLGQLAFGDRNGLPLPPICIVGISAAATSGLLLLTLCWSRSYRFTLPATSLLASDAPFDMADPLLIPSVAEAAPTPTSTAPTPTSTVPPVGVEAIVDAFITLSRSRTDPPYETR